MESRSLPKISAWCSPPLIQNTLKKCFIHRPLAQRCLSTSIFRSAWSFRLLHRSHIFETPICNVFSPVVEPPSNPHVWLGISRTGNDLVNVLCRPFVRVPEPPALTPSSLMLPIPLDAILKGEPMVVHSPSLRSRQLQIQAEPRSERVLPPRYFQVDPHLCRTRYRTSYRTSIHTLHLCLPRFACSLARIRLLYFHATF